MFNVSNYWNLLLSRHSPQNTLSQSSPPSDCTPRLFQIIRLSDCTPRLSSGPAGFSLSPPRKSVKDAWLKTKSGSTTITCHQHQGWHFPWVSMYPRTKMTPQHMFMILWFSNNWGFNLIIKPTFRQGFPFLSLTPLEEKNCNWKVFKSCHAFVCLAFDYLVDWKSPRMRIWRIIPRINLPNNICQNPALISLPSNICQNFAFHEVFWINKFHAWFCVNLDFGAEQPPGQKIWKRNT